MGGVSIPMHFTSREEAVLIFCMPKDGMILDSMWLGNRCSETGIYLKIKCDLV